MKHEAKDKAFELVMSWVCDESNGKHRKVTVINLVSLESNLVCILYSCLSNIIIFCTMKFLMQKGNQSLK